MKNIPMFTSPYGVATLILREIPWSGSAYVLVRSVWNDQTASLLEECRGFCRAVGAKEIFAAYDAEELPAKPAYDMIRMMRPKAGLPAGEKLELEPLTRENSAVYLEIYNRCFVKVPSAASYDQTSLEPLYDEDLAWLAKVNGNYAGIAEISKAGLEGIAVLPAYRGLGRDLALAVLQMVPSPVLHLKVASTNTRAIALYQRLGFTAECVEKRWFLL